jgi:hypothetical protein
MAFLSFNQGMWAGPGYAGGQNVTATHTRGQTTVFAKLTVKKP